MGLNWGAFGMVFVVAFGSAIVVVALVSFAMVAFSARVPAAEAADGYRSTMSPATGTAIGVVCLTVVAVIVLYGLGIITGIIG
jgi:hypothetical protein